MPDDMFDQYENLLNGAMLVTMRLDSGCGYRTDTNETFNMKLASVKATPKRVGQVLWIPLDALFDYFLLIL